MHIYTYDLTLIIKIKTQRNEQPTDGIIDEIADELMSLDDSNDVIIEQHRTALSSSFIVNKDDLYQSIIGKIKIVESLQCCDLEVISIDSPHYVSLTESAIAAGLTKAAISNFYQGIRGNGDFPPPTMKVSSKNPLWLWSEVSQWLVDNGKMPNEVLNSAKIINRINLALQIRKTSSLNEMSNVIGDIIKDA